MIIEMAEIQITYDLLPNFSLPSRFRRVMTNLILRFILDPQGHQF